MKVTYRGTLGDRLAFMAYGLVRNPVVVLILGGCVLLLTFSDALPSAHDATVGKPPVTKIFAFAITEILVLLPFALILIVLILLTAISRRNKTLDCERTITLGEEGYTGESQYGRTEARWAIVQKLGRTRRHIFIYTNQSSAIVVPRRAFESPAQWDAFYEYCRERTCGRGKKSTQA